MFDMIILPLYGRLINVVHVLDIWAVTRASATIMLPFVGRNRLSSNQELSFVISITI